MTNRPYHFYVAHPATDSIDATNLELFALYDLRASAYLNLLYYGSRATTWSGWNLALQVTAAIGSLGAVTVFLTLGTDPIWKWVSASVGVISAVCAMLPAVIGHAEKINKFEKLHFANCELFELAKRTVGEIRRSGIITTEQMGGVKLLNDLGSRLGRIDDADLKEELRDRCEKAVRERFPAESLWYAGAHAEQPFAPAEAGPRATDARQGEPSGSSASRQD